MGHRGRYKEKSKVGYKIARDFKVNRYVYFMAVPVLAYYLIFCYWPMFGAVIAFKDFKPGLGIWGSPWVGLTHFSNFLSSIFFWRLVRNTVLISVYSLIFAFPAPILFAILMNELRSRYFKNLVQTISYLPHFISTVVICGILVNFMATDGLINSITSFLGGERANLLLNAELFRTIYISSNIWTELGWSSIIYLAVLSNIDQSLYEAAKIDGAGRWKQMLHITLPSLSSIIIILLILTIGNLLSVGWEKIILLYNPSVYETADVISSYVYRRGLEQSDYSYSTAIGLFNSVVNFILLVLANKISKKINDVSLW